MRVKAKATGVFGKRRKAGETFDIPSEEALGSWMVALNAGTRPRQPARKAQAARAKPRKRAAAVGGDKQA